MAVPNLANTWKIIYKYHAGITHFENVVHVTAPTLSSPQLIANEAGNAWTAAASFQDRQVAAVVYDKIQVQPYDGVTAPFDLTAAGYTNAAGVAVGSIVPAQVCAIGTLRSLTSGRSARGRMYVGGFTSSHVDPTGAQWSSGSMANIQAAFTAFYTQINASPTIDVLVVYSHKLNSKVSVSEILARQYFGSQRRRAEQAEP